MPRQLLAKSWRKKTTECALTFQRVNESGRDKNINEKLCYEPCLLVTRPSQLSTSDCCSFPLSIYRAHKYKRKTACVSAFVNRARQRFGRFPKPHTGCSSCLTKAPDVMFIIFKNGCGAPRKARVLPHCLPKKPGMPFVAISFRNIDKTPSEKPGNDEAYVRGR